jgi:hypothetical protein
MNSEARVATWARLAAAGLVQGDPPPPLRTRSPWYVRLMQGGSGWLAAMLLLGFADGIVPGLFEEAPAALLVGVLACVPAAVTMRSWPDSDFAGQLGFAVSLAGQALIAHGLWELLGGRLGVLAAVMAGVMAVLFVLVPQFLHRVWSAWSALSFAWLAFLDGGLGPLVPGLLTGAFAAVWLAEAAPAPFGGWPRPAGWGLALAVVQFPITGWLLWDLAASIHDGIAPPHSRAVDWSGAVLSAGVLVAVVVRLLAREGRALTSRPGVGALATAVVLGVATLEAPDLAPALVVVLIGFAVGSRELTGLGILALVTFLAHFYYALHATLLEKSLLMVTLGAVLLLAWGVVRWAWPHGGGEEHA